MGDWLGEVRGDFCSLSTSAGEPEVLILFLWEAGEPSLWTAADRGRMGRLLKEAEAGTEPVRSADRRREYRNESHTQTTSYDIA